MRCIQLLAVSAILAITTAIRPCYSEGWRGRPWHENTNAPTWQALQAEYQPFEQLAEALIERADVVRATVNTNFPRLELVQTWMVDVCSVTNVVGSNDVIIASGFPLMPSGTDVNGTYINQGAYYETADARAYIGSGGWNHDWYLTSVADWFMDYEADTLEADQWYDYTDDPIAGTTAFAPEGIEVNLVTTNVTTTNAFSPFEYSVEYDGTTYSGTGFPHLTYAAMEWVDQAIEDLSDYYSPIIPSTNLPPTGASVWLWQIDWDSHGQYSLIGGAEVGTNVSGTYTYSTTGRTGTVYLNTNDWEISAYTRQPPVTSQWIMAEWVWGPTNWIEVVEAGETNMVAELGWVGEGNVSPMDMRLPMGSAGPLVEAYSATSGAPISVTVDLRGDVKLDHWWNAGGIVTGVTESVESGDHATNLWYRLGGGTEIASGTGTATGDYVIVSYKGPITLYGARPYRLYASDLDERAAVIDGLHLQHVEHGWTDFWSTSTLIPMWTNAFWGNTTGNTATVSAYTISPTNAPTHPAWSNVIPHSITTTAWEGPPGGTVFIPDYNDWGTYEIERKSVLFVEDGVTNLSNTVSVTVSDTTAAQLMYQLTFTTNTVQGESFPSSFVIRNPIPCGRGLNLGQEHYAVFENDQPFLFYEIVDLGGGVQGTNAHYRIQITSDEHPIATGTNYYLSGLIGSPTLFGGKIPYNICMNNQQTVILDWTTNTEVNVGETFSASVSWRPVWVDKDPDLPMLPYYTPIPGFIDWGVTNGFQYK